MTPFEHHSCRMVSCSPRVTLVIHHNFITLNLGVLNQSSYQNGQIWDQEFQRDLAMICAGNQNANYGHRMCQLDFESCQTMGIFD